MKTKSGIILSLALFLLFVLSGTSGYTQKQTDKRVVKQQQEVNPAIPDPPPPPPPPDIKETKRGHQPDLPGLTDEQREKIKQADLEHMKRMTPLRNQSREKMARLQTVLATTPFDAPAADQTADELGKIRTGMLKESIRHDRAVRELLTPEQQVIFDSKPKPFLKMEKQAVIH